jgi:signal transduction histidine kinase/ActR/RegA family two-component response regulator
MSLKQLLSERRDDILATFVREVERKDLPPRQLPKSVLVNHIPVFLDEINDELIKGGGRESHEALDLNATARQHGGQRWTAGYDLEAVVREYGVLRHAIVETARAAQMPLDVDELETLSRYLSVGIAGATAQYVRSREEQLTARQADLQFLTEAGELLGSSLDYHSTLTRLTRLIVPRLADFCVLRLEGFSVDELPIAHVDPAKSDLVRQVVRNLESPFGHRAVIQSGAPLLIESTPPDYWESMTKSPEVLASIQQLGPTSWLVVPFRIKNNVIGTLALGCSDSARHYSPADLLLASDLARRAASAIDNAQLYELSRTERARAEAATRAKDEFVAVVTHELRTPLNVIIGWVRLLRSGSLAPGKKEHALEVIERNADAQSRLVSDLLDISRVLTGKVRIDPAQVDLGSILTLVLEDARHALDSKRLLLHLSLTREDTVLRGDAERLKQVIWNLLLNAIKFTPKGGQVWVSLQRVESDLELTITDSGIGMSPEFLPHVFDSFRQFDSKITRPHAGLGIGLSIAKHLVDLHGGSIDAHSDGAGKGASFFVRLPVSPIISTTVGVTKVPATTDSRRQQFTRNSTLAGVNVLIVDDEDDARELLRIILESCNMTVYDAGSAGEALSTVANEQVDVIISDIGMPERDGYSLIRDVRAMPVKDKATIPAIALTAFTRNEDRTRALLEGFNVHMAKPVEPAELLVALADLLGRVVRNPKADPAEQP